MAYAVVNGATNSDTMEIFQQINKINITNLITFPKTEAHGIDHTVLIIEVPYNKVQYFLPDILKQFKYVFGENYFTLIDQYIGKTKNGTIHLCDGDLNRDVLEVASNAIRTRRELYRNEQHNKTTNQDPTNGKNL